MESGLKTGVERGGKGRGSCWNLPGVAVADDLDLDSLAEDRGEEVLDEVLVHPSFHFAHPEKTSDINLSPKVERNLETYQRVLAASLEAGMGAVVKPCSLEPFMVAPLAGAPVAGVVYSAILICA